MDKSSKIFVAGHRGLVGSAILRNLQEAGYTNLVHRTRQELDLTKQDKVAAFFAEVQPEYVFDAAARVGGIWANNTYPADFIYDNLAIQTNLIHKLKSHNLLFYSQHHQPLLHYDMPDALQLHQDKDQ